MRKTGRLSKEEWEYIANNADSLSCHQIAENLNRAVEPIITQLAKIGKSPNKVQDFEIQAEYDLKNRMYWKEIKQQFDAEEQELFLYLWSKIVGQFKKDILPTEELQIIHLIKLELLLSRNLKNRQKCLKEIDNIETQLVNEAGKDTPDAVKMAELDRKRALLLQSNQATSGEYKYLLEKHSTGLKELKATREMRIEKIENNKATFTGLLTRIARDSGFKREMSTYMEKMRLAMEAEKKRLSDYHTYVDGQIDQPLLNHETVL